MSHPTTWHTRPAAQALIGLIAAQCIEPQTRAVRHEMSDDDAPEYFTERYYDCDEYNQLAVMQHAAITAALDAKQASGGSHFNRNAEYQAFRTLLMQGQDLAGFIAGEIAARTQQVAA